MAKDIYYKILSGGSTTHFHSLSSARKAAKRIANRDGGSVDIEKMSHKAYHRGGSASKGVVATVEPKRKNPGTTIRGWVKARAVKIVRNKRGQAVTVKIKT